MMEVTIKVGDVVKLPNEETGWVYYMAKESGLVEMTRDQVKVYYKVESAIRNLCESVKSVGGNYAYTKVYEAPLHIIIEDIVRNQPDIKDVVLAMLDFHCIKKLSQDLAEYIHTIEMAGSANFRKEE